MVTLTLVIESEMKRTIERKFMPRPSIDANHEYNLALRLKPTWGFVGWIQSFIISRMEVCLLILGKLIGLELKLADIGFLQTKICI